jgi:hypothetical protein
MVVRRIFDSKEELNEQEAGENYIMRFHNLYVSHNITRIFKPRKMK